MNVKEETSVPEQKPLQEGADFYFEDDLMVLTEDYLKKRGYCCGNECRHCPYDHVNVPNHNR